MYQSAPTPAPRTWEAGTEDYKVLASKLASGATTRYWQKEADAAWLFDGSTLWTFDDPETMCFKTSYVRHAWLSGVMFWELSGDTASGDLVTTLSNALNQPGGGFANGLCQGKGQAGQ